MYLYSQNMKYLPAGGQSSQHSTWGHTGSWLWQRGVLELLGPVGHRQQATAGCWRTTHLLSFTLHSHSTKTLLSLFYFFYSPQNPDRYEQIITAIQPYHAVIRRAVLSQNIRKFTGQFNQISVPQRHRAPRHWPAVICHSFPVWVHRSSRCYKLLQCPSSHITDETFTAHSLWLLLLDNYLQFIFLIHILFISDEGAYLFVYR